MHRSVPVVAVLADPYGKHGGNADGPVVGQIPIVERVMEGRAEVRSKRPAVAGIRTDKENQEASTFYKNHDDVLLFYCFYY
jgi:hypothetical protein